MRETRPRGKRLGASNERFFGRATSTRGLIARAGGGSVRVVARRGRASAESVHRALGSAATGVVGSNEARGPGVTQSSLTRLAKRRGGQPNTRWRDGALLVPRRGGTFASWLPIAHPTGSASC